MGPRVVGGVLHGLVCALLCSCATECGGSSADGADATGTDSAPGPDVVSTDSTPGRDAFSPDAVLRDGASGPDVASPDAALRDSARDRQPGDLIGGADSGAQTDAARTDHTVDGGGESCAPGAAPEGEACCLGVRSGSWSCEDDGILRCEVATGVHRFAVPHQPPPSGPALLEWHDRALFAATLQGIVNRDAINLFLDAMGHDAVWLPRMQAAGQPLHGVPLHDVSSEEELFELYRCGVNGLVLWDPAVPATLNVGTSVAGAADLVLLRHDPSSTSLYQRLQALPEPPPVVVDLRGKFTGAGLIPDTARPSSGSAKCDAYLWLGEHYLKPGLLDWRYTGYLIDGWWLDRSLGANATQVFNRDFLVQHRAVVFDLSSWGDEVPVDDPGQALGTDQATLLELMRNIYDLHGGEGITQILGFTPWAWKYTDYDGAGGGHHPVATEWDLVRQVSAYNATLDADALGMTTLANATVYSRAALDTASAGRSLTPQPQQLRDRGLWDNRLVNGSFDDNNHVGHWTVALSDYLTITQPAQTHGGVNLLHARARVDVAPNALWQQVAASTQPGDAVRASVWLRSDSGSGDVTVGLSALGGEVEAASVTATISTTWQRVQVDLDTLRAHDSLEIRLSLPVGGPLLRIDDAAMWIEGRPVGVAARHYLVWHVGDYDAGAWLYQMLPTTWDGTRRGEVPLAWALNPNLMDRFAIAFAHVWSTATPRDFFSAADTLAGYINLTQLHGARTPSGLPDGRLAFERFARRYLQRAQLFHTVFALNGSSGPYDDASWQLLARLAGHGVAYNMAGQISRAATWRHNAAFVGQDADLSPSDVAASLEIVEEKTRGVAPEFHVFRSVLADPGDLSELSQQAFHSYPQRLITVVSPKELFTLIGLHLGHEPRYRAFISPAQLLDPALAGATIGVQVDLLNDGWDTWTAGYRVGFHLSPGDQGPAPHSLPSDPQGYPTRCSLPGQVEPGQQVRAECALPLPTTTGTYTLQVDVVHEGVTWFEAQNGVPRRQVLVVGPQ